MNLSPIVLFVYNRPWHTQQTVEALQKNKLAKESELFIYADGKRKKKEEDNDIEKVRQYIKTIAGFKKITIIEREKNFGLADNIITGVTEIVNEYGKIIVLEDDIITSSGFLKYMNDALTLYKNEKQVMHISGYMFPVKNTLPDTFFFNTASCWGWATWSDSWENFNPDPKILLAELKRKNLIKTFNLNGAYKFTDQLIKNIKRKNKTWAVKWYASFFLKGGSSLHPYPSLCNNIGFDGTGENCGDGSSNIFFWKKLANEIIVIKHSNFDDSVARKEVELFFRNISKFSIYFEQVIIRLKKIFRY